MTGVSSDKSTRIHPGRSSLESSWASGSLTCTNERPGRGGWGFFGGRINPKPIRKVVWISWLSWGKKDEKMMNNRDFSFSTGPVMFKPWINKPRLRLFFIGGIPFKRVSYEMTMTGEYPPNFHKPYGLVSSGVDIMWLTKNSAPFGKKAPRCRIQPANNQPWMECQPSWRVFSASWLAGKSSDYFVIMDFPMEKMNEICSGKDI